MRDHIRATWGGMSWLAMGKVEGTSSPQLLLCLLFPVSSQSCVSLTKPVWNYLLQKDDSLITSD